MSAISGVGGRVYGTELIDLKSGDRIKFSDLASGAGGDTVTVANITDASTLGRTVLKAADAPAARTAIGATDLAIGTTGTTAMAGNKTPTTTQRGGVLQQAAIANLTAAPTQDDVNAILAALRSAGLLAS